jgi:pimeloyl-ACP methyl ester carboxylesterase
MQRDHFSHRGSLLFMTEPTLHHVACHDAAGGHRMAYWQWGDPHSSHVILCVHGLTRQGRDFDVLAQALLARAGGGLRVVCPDIVGRGESDWLKNPDGYQLPQYAADVIALIGQLHAEQAIGTLDYAGTSMGGLIGIAVAGSPSVPLPTPIRRLVINDVGPTLDTAAVKRIGTYVGQGGRYATLDAAADAMWALSSTFGPHSPAQWLELSRHMVVPAASRSAAGDAKVAATGDAGPYLLHYDPAIALSLRAMTAEAAMQGEAVLWALYDAITAKTLLTRGAQSDLLSRETATAMTARGPHAQLVEFDGVGHAPTFVAPEQSAAVASFLLD